jgi:hypothetical protein
VSRSIVLGLVVAAVAAVAIAVRVGGDGAETTPATTEPARPPTASTVTADPRLLPRPQGHIVGYVRDVDGRPVPGATVRLADGRRSARANRSGRFALPARPGRRTVVAVHPGYTRQSVTTNLRRGRGNRVDFALAVTAPDRIPVPNSADRLIQWTSCDEIAGLSEAELRRWTARGIDGFVCQTGRIFGMGGRQRFTGNHRTHLRGPATRLQRRLMASPAVHRARQGKLLLYLGFYASNYFNKRTPLRDWFDDHGWSRGVFPQVRDLAAAARSMGFAGLAIDQELYPQEGNVETASWSVRYPGGRHSQAQVRAMVKRRGQQLMDTMVRAFPGVEVIAYGTVPPQGWQAKVAAELHHEANAYADNVQVDLWDGLSSVEGYSAIRWMDAFFYKIPQLPGASWDTALEYNANSLYSYLSRRFSNWSYASSRLHISPFSWVDEGPAEFDQARDPGYVGEQLEAFKRWGAGGAFANYAYAPLGAFDYGPYEGALRQASSPALVDRRPPKLELSGPIGTSRRVRAGDTVNLTGATTDDFAIRAVRWYDDRGRQGVARLTWKASGDERSGWKGPMSWSIPNLAVPGDAKRITISAEDIHGLATQLQLGVSR